MPQVRTALAQRADKPVTLTLPGQTEAFEVANLFPRATGSAEGKIHRTAPGRQTRKVAIVAIRRKIIIANALLRDNRKWAAERA